MVEPAAHNGHGPGSSPGGCTSLRGCAASAGRPQMAKAVRRSPTSGRRRTTLQVRKVVRGGAQPVLKTGPTFGSRVRLLHLPPLIWPITLIILNIFSKICFHPHPVPTRLRPNSSAVPQLAAGAKASASGARRRKHKFIAVGGIVR